MYKILLTSHGSIAKGFYETLPMILGTQEDVAYLCFHEKMSIVQFEEQMERQLMQTWGRDAVLILADMMGGTPSRIAMQIMQKRAGCAIVCGMNLPMILEAYMKREEDWPLGADSVVKAGEPSLIAYDMMKNEEDE